VDLARIEVDVKKWRNIPGDAVTFGPVPSRRLGQSLGVKIAVITNSSLIWREDVREELVRKVRKF
jgi:wyosine [tRNA(Phe)-imidazoG37] synthetase (radical SAM superfamily)